MQWHNGNPPEYEVAHMQLSNQAGDSIFLLFPMTALTSFVILSSGFVGLHSGKKRLWPIVLG